RQLVGFLEALRELVPADDAGRLVVLPARAREVAAHDALERQHLEPPALGRAPFGTEGEQVVRHDLARPGKPEPGKVVSTRPLSGISVGRTTSKVEIRSLATRSRRSES